ncbi:MAG: bifunctional hydroxymethylpyrimidine kinase/phosphomethylpyrimidine kinase [Nitrospirota bacterium]
MKTALTIAGSDPTGGAGLQADLRTFKSMGVYGISVPSVLTAQNTNGVFDIYELPPDFFITQIDVLLRDIHPDASKTGMLNSFEIVRITAEKIGQYSLKNIVVDPVTSSSTGVLLIKDEALEAMKQCLFPLAKVITPNINEASLFTGIDIKDEQDMKRAAARLKEFGPETVIITGGHLVADLPAGRQGSTLREEKTIDIFFDGREFLSLQRDKLSGEFHGTGCVFSSAVTACLALGYDVREAAVKANEFVWNAIKSAVSIGKGMKILNI